MKIPGSNEFHASLKARGRGAKEWASRNCQVEYLGGDTFEVVASIGPQVVRHKDTKEFVELHYVENPDFASERDCRVFAQNSHVAIEVYDYYVKLFDPDYETVSVYDERFVAQYLFKEDPKEIWRDVGAWNPQIEILSLEDGVEIKKIFDTDYGSETLEISYILRNGAFLKHNISFTNKMTQKTFRVIMKLAGITSNKIKHEHGEERITAEKHITTPFMFFGEDGRHLKLTEYLWSLGVLSGEDNEIWTPVTLKDIILDIHAHGTKADIIIGNYVLAKSESLEIDPTTTTWQVNASADDVSFRGSTGDLVGPLGSTAGSITETNSSAGWHAVDTKHNKYSAARWAVTIPQGAIINSAYFKGRCFEDTGSGYTRLYGEDADDTVQFSTLANFRGRPRTDAYINWNPGSWQTGIWYTSLDIKTIIQEIISRGGWSSGNSLVVFWGWYTDTATSKYIRTWNYAAGDAPKLTVTYTPIVIPTVTTQDATGLGIGQGTLNGTITATGGENCDERGFDWDYDSGVPYAYSWTESNSYGTGAFSHQLTGLTQGATVYFRGKAHNSAGWGYGSEKSFRVPKAWTKTLTEPLGLVDSVQKKPDKTFLEALGLIDVYSRIWTVYRTYSEILGLTDAVSKEPSKTFPEVLGLVDAVRKAPSIVKTELLGLADFISKASSVVKSEALGLKDTFSRMWAAHKTLSEILGLRDTFSRGVSKTLSEILDLKDTLTGRVCVTFSRFRELVAGLIRRLHSRV